jgi:hypothetical protein
MGTERQDVPDPEKGLFRPHDPEANGALWLAFQGIPDCLDTGCSKVELGRPWYGSRFLVPTGRQ